MPRRIVGAISLLIARRTEGAPLSPAERELRNALPRAFTAPVECEEELAVLIGKAMTEGSRERAPDREHPGPARTRRARATP